MWPLGEHLRLTPVPITLSPDEQAAWQKFLDILPKTNLEQALTDVPLPANLTRHVVTTTWDYLNPRDYDVFQSVCLNRNMLGLTKLFKHLFSSTAREIDVITPNYDRLAEYSANAAGFEIYTGFSYGLFGRKAPAPPPKIFEGKIQLRTVNVWKVHGCFGWFADSDGSITGLPPMPQRPPGMSPVIVTPGIEKYRRTYDEPFRTIMHCADKCLQNASAYFCVGYGFNDQHLQTHLVNRCNAESIPLVLITKAISNTAHDFFATGKCQRYLALEEDGNATKMYSNEFPKGIRIDNCEIWQLDKFLQLVI